jgi:DNA-binding protein HU-beta
MKLLPNVISALSLMVVCIIAMMSTAHAFTNCSPAIIRTSHAYSSTRVHSTPDKAETFRKADFIAAVAEKTGLNKKESEEALKAVLDVITEQVSTGKRVNLPSFGTFTLKERAARKGRNPQTGEPLDIAASKSPGFSAAKAWKDAVNGRS